MSNETITLTATKREVLGKKVHALRAEGQTPAVIHDHGKASIHVSVEEKELKKAYSAAGKHHVVELTVDGKKYSTMIKDVTFKPATNLAYHTVFQSVKANEKVKAEVPVNLVGDEIPAEKASLLVLQSLNEVEVEALPRDLVDALDIDATVLTEAGDSVTVADIKAPSGVTILTDPETTVATVETPKDQIAEADAAAAELAADADTPEADTEASAEPAAEESEEATEADK